MRKKAKLHEVRVTEMPSKYFATDAPVYILTAEGKKISEIDYGSLIYTGKTVPGPAGFNCAVCLVWEGRDDAEIKNILIRNGV